MQADEVTAASAVIERANLSSAELNALAKGQNSYIDAQGQVATVRSNLTGADDATRKAAIQEGVAKGTVGDVEDIIKSSDDMTQSQRKILSESVAKSSAASKATHLGGQTIDDIAQGNVKSEEDLDRVMERAVQKGKYSAEKLADNDKDSLKRLSQVLQNPQTPELKTPEGQLQLNSVRNQAARALDDQRISGRITDAQRSYLQGIRTPPGQTPTAPPPPPSP
jgi:DNA invertase Pin-like site-specific DNA recombinase